MEVITVDTIGAAQRLGLSAKTLENKRVSGDGPPYLKLGRSVRYRTADLDSWMEARVIGSTSEKAAA